MTEKSEYYNNTKGDGVPGPSRGLELRRMATAAIKSPGQGEGAAVARREVVINVTGSEDQTSRQGNKKTDLVTKKSGAISEVRACIHSIYRKILAEYMKLIELKCPLNSLL